MVVCDSLRKLPYALKAAEMEMLMSSCAAVGAAGKTSWAAFLATKEQQAANNGTKDSEATAIASERGEGTACAHLYSACRAQPRKITSACRAHAERDQQCK